MALVRLRPLSLGSSGRLSNVRCAACRGPVRTVDESVRVYGEVFHRNCAFYTPRGREKP